MLSNASLSPEASTLSAASESKGLRAHVCLAEMRVWPQLLVSNSIEPTGLFASGGGAVVFQVLDRQGSEGLADFRSTGSVNHAWRTVSASQQRAQALAFVTMCLGTGQSFPKKGGPGFGTTVWHFSDDTCRVLRVPRAVLPAVPEVSSQK